MFQALEYIFQALEYMFHDLKQIVSRRRLSDLSP